MESLGLTISFEFFKERMDFLRWNEKQQRALEDLLDCDIYGGPMKVWEAEYKMWQFFFKRTRTLDLFTAFAAAYGAKQLERKLEYNYNEGDFFEFETGVIELADNQAINDENWLRVAWDEILRLEAE